VAIPTVKTGTGPTAGVTAGGRGTRSRAGNAMGRTREAALLGATQAIAKYGSRKATMGDIAMLAGIAKATLYNHFRTRDDVYAAVVAAEVDRVAGQVTAQVTAQLGRDGEGRDGLEVALATAAKLVGQHPAARRVALDEPAVLAALATIGPGPAWESARGHIAAALADTGVGSPPASVDLVLRYLVSQLLTPSPDAERLAVAALLAAALSVPAGPGQAGTEHTSS
jgi:AcrR family transcriptional regulator